MATIENTTQASPSRVTRSPLLRGIYFLLGVLFFAGGLISFLPGIPTADLFFLSAFFFARSSDRFHNWMVNHRIIGKFIRQYSSGDGFTVRSKAVAIVGITLSLGASILFLIDPIWLKIGLAAVGVYAIWFVVTRPTRSMPAMAPDIATNPVE